MRAEILAVGTELLLGDIVNGNAAWLGRRLADAGVDVTRSVAVGDDVDGIAAALTEALGRTDTVVVTGGLGPTQDDLTREAMAAAAGVALHRDEALAEELLERFAVTGRRIPVMNLRQAQLPEGATPIPNPVGTAPGVRIELLGGVAYALPGVPVEMQAMVEESVLPDVLARWGRPSAIVSRTIHTAGMWESAVAEALADVHEEMAAGDGSLSLAWLAGRGMTRVRVTARAGDEESARALIAPYEARILERLGPAVWGWDADSLASVVHERLLERGETLAVAESLTAGLLGAELTTVPGSSATFLGGVITYSTQSKRALLGVSPEVLDESGAVSAATAVAMATGVRHRLGATYGLGLTGVAGPAAQEGKPPGTVYIGLAGPDGSHVRPLRLRGGRDMIRQIAVTSALDLLRRRLTGLGAPD